MRPETTKPGASLSTIPKLNVSVHDVRHALLRTGVQVRRPWERKSGTVPKPLRQMSGIQPSGTKRRPGSGPLTFNLVDQQTPEKLEELFVRRGAQISPLVTTERGQVRNLDHRPAMLAVELGTAHPFTPLDRPWR